MVESASLGDRKAEGRGASLHPNTQPGKGFVHLHLHSEYSLLDGGNRLDKLVRRVKELGMHAVAVTDHGNLFGAASFYQTALAEGIQPILGVEAYVTPPGRSRTDKTYTGVSDGGYHLVLLAETQEGWDNLVYLCSEAYLTGFYYKPRIDRELLEKHSAGLIAINGHLGSEIGDHLLAYESSGGDKGGDKKYWDKAVESAFWHARVFGKSQTTGDRHRASERTCNGASSDAESRVLNADSLPPHSSDPRTAGLFLELQHHVDEQISINKHILRLARELKLPIVCDNDSHFLKAEDHDAHDTLICISMGKIKDDPARLKYPPELYVKSPQEMRELFHSEYGSDETQPGRIACDNTLIIADRCAEGAAKPPIGMSNAPMVRVRIKSEGETVGVKPKSRSADMESSLPRHDDPRFRGDLSAWYAAYCRCFEVVPFAFPPEADDAERNRLSSVAKDECEAALRLLARAGSVWRYGPGVLNTRQDSAESAEAETSQAFFADVQARLERELKILCDKGISAYFLIVWDFVNEGRQRAIPANARGSGVGTMVGYVMGLSNACPVRYGLLFERFTDPDRSEFPDIDIDLCQDGRAEVIDYVRKKYGHVAQIITFGTLKARAAIRDVARVLNIALPVADRVAKLIPEQLNITLDEALEQEPELKAAYEGNAAALEKLNDKLPTVQHATAQQISALIDNARTLEGQARHASVHAAGVIVATRPLWEIVPLYKPSNAADHEIVTQWDGPTCEKMGLLKMDFLGLRTLSVIERAKKLIRETLSEEEIWKAVGRGEEFKQWQSGKEAEWQSEDQNVSRHAGVAARDGSGAGDLHGDALHAQGRTLQPDQSDASSCSIDPDEHCGRVRAAHASRTPARASAGLGFAHGTHDGLRDCNVPADDSDHKSSPRTVRRGGSDAQLADPQTRSQGTGAASQDDTQPYHGLSATSPLRHSATTPLLCHPLDLDRLTFDDPHVFQIFQRADTTGVFQFESGGMRRLLMDMRPDRLEDLIAANALFRPGPMDLIPDYNRRKHGMDRVPSLHPIVDQYTRETYGVMVYQEQVMQIVHGLGGIKLRDAYTLIKNISKKKHDKIEKERPKFIEGAQKQGLSRENADELFELILKFAGYGFNKSHSTGYAIVAYQTAYLKTYFPNQYMAAFLTFESGAQKASDWIQYVEDCKKVVFTSGKIGVEVRPPDVNLSQKDFAVVFDPDEPRDAQHGHIRFGLGAIKGVGEKAIEAVLRERDAAGASDPIPSSERAASSTPLPRHSVTSSLSPRPFTSLFDFCERVMSSGASAGNGHASSGGAILNKTTVEALIKCGAMDSLHSRQERAAMLATVEAALSAAQKITQDKLAGQGGLFFGQDASAPVAGKSKTSAGAAGQLLKVTPWGEPETLAKEKDVLGFYVSSHPLERWLPWTGVFATASCESAKNSSQDQRVVMPGLVQAVRTIVIKNGKSAGQKMAIVTIEDMGSTVEVVMFADCFANFGYLAQPDQVVFVLGRIDRSRAGMQQQRNQNAGEEGGDSGRTQNANLSGVQVIVDRLVPIDGVPLLPGRLLLRFDTERLNGSGEACLQEASDLLHQAAAEVLAQIEAGEKPPAFPIDLVVDTPLTRVRLETDPRLKIVPNVELIDSLRELLGDGCVRVVGGVALDQNEKNRGKWARRTA